MADCTNFTNASMLTIGWTPFVTYDVLLPYYLLVGLTGNIILLVTFYKQSKQESTYTYQVLLAVCKTLQIISDATAQYFISLVTAQQDSSSVSWFQRNYTLMWLNYRIIGPMSAHVMISAVMITAAMAADRVFALTLPVKYITIDHGKHQMIAAVVCFTLPVISSFRYAFVFDIVSAGDHYKVSFDTKFRASTAAAASLYVGLVMRIICIFTLVVMNVIMVIAFRYRMANRAKLVRSGAERKITDRALFVLNFCQSVLMFINQMPRIAMNAYVFFVTNFTICTIRAIIPPVAHGTMFLTEPMDLLVIMVINRKLRRDVANAIRCGVPADNGQRNGVRQLQLVKRVKMRERMNATGRSIQNEWQTVNDHGTNSRMRQAVIVTV